MPETERRVIETEDGLVYFQRACDFTDEDYAAHMSALLYSSRADLVIGGVLRVRGGAFKRAAFFEYPQVLEGAEGKWKLLEQRYLAFGLCGCMVKKEIWEKVQAVEENGQLYAVLRESGRIAADNDYKYYFTEDESRGFYDGADSGTEDFSVLMGRYRHYRELFPEFTQEQFRGLFSRKERFLLSHPDVGRLLRDGGLWMEKRMPGICRGLNRTADRMMEGLSGTDNRLCKMLEESRGEERVLILGTPEYHNLGDHAIAYAQERFAARFFPEKRLISVTEREISAQWRCLKQNVAPDDILLLQGGGNMGDAYGSIEELRLKILKGFPDNRTVLMPQTVHFTDRPEAVRLKKRMQAVYGVHRRLLLTARERTSYGRMKEYFPDCPVALCPDIVMSLCIQKDIPAVERKGILLLLRTDAEGLLNVGQLLEVKKLCGRYTDRAVMAETSISHGVPGDRRMEELRAKWSQLAGAGLVITDRLHGMIFSAITGTPCIVLANYNHKVAESFEWLKGLGYVHFCGDFSMLPGLLEEVWKETAAPHVYDDSAIREYYEQLAGEIRRM